MNNTNIIAITNQKGGVGKTTTAVNLASCMADLHPSKKILLVDLDPQGNASMACGYSPSEAPTLAEFLLEIADFSSACRRAHDHFDYLPSDNRLTVAEVRLLNQARHEYRLKDRLMPAIATNHYDLVIIDCPPSLNVLTLNALVAATHVLIPTQCEYYALEGLTSLLNTVTQIKAKANTSLEILGVIRTMYDGRSRLTQAVSHQLASHFGRQLLRTIIPRNVRLAEAPSHGLPVNLYDNRCQGNMAHLALAAEVSRLLNAPQLTTPTLDRMEAHV